MKAKVIIAQATAETAEALYGLVKEDGRYNSNQGLIPVWIIRQFSFQLIDTT